MPVVGVDEAGKGPVLGSMFAAAVRVTDPTALPDDLDDSKSLAPEHREALDAELRASEDVQIGVVEVKPARIDDPATDMNRLTVEAHVAALTEIIESEDRVLLDAGDVNADRFARRVAAPLSVEVDLRAEHGADATYAIVSAASIVAKVARDAHVADLAETHGAVGSGYPGDKTTRAYLAGYVEEHDQLPPFARRSWQTCQDVLAAAEQSALEEF